MLLTNVLHFQISIKSHRYIFSLFYKIISTIIQDPSYLKLKKKMLQ